MKTSGYQLHLLVGIGAISASTAHTITDIAEWLVGGFSAPQLWVNYLAFIVLPFVMIGLYAFQRPKIGMLGLVGALLYGSSFIFFSHTTLYALAEGISDYPSLWARLGNIYTVHGMIMIVGGLAFSVASYRARVYPSWTSIVFGAGVLFNLILAIFAAPEMIQTLGSALRNIGIIGMGLYLLLNHGST